MKKRIKRSGLLSRMTVRDLSQSQLRGVVGGLPPDPTEPTISLDATCDC